MRYGPARLARHYASRPDDGAHWLVWGAGTFGKPRNRLLEQPGSSWEATEPSYPGEVHGNCVSVYTKRPLPRARVLLSAFGDNSLTRDTRSRDPIAGIVLAAAEKRAVVVD